MENRIPKISDLQPGDQVFFKSGSVRGVGTLALIKGDDGKGRLAVIAAVPNGAFGVVGELSDVVGVAVYQETPEEKSEREFEQEVLVAVRKLEQSTGAKLTELKYVFSSGKIRVIVFGES